MLSVWHLAGGAALATVRIPAVLGNFWGQSEKPVAILAPVFSTMHTIWIV